VPDVNEVVPDVNEVEADVNEVEADLNEVEADLNEVEADRGPVAADKNTRATLGTVVACPWTDVQGFEVLTSQRPAAPTAGVAGPPAPPARGSAPQPRTYPRAPSGGSRVSHLDRLRANRATPPVRVRHPLP
jgi:hypothetical protein